MSASLFCQNFSFYGCASGIFCMRRQLILEAARQPLLKTFEAGYCFVLISWNMKTVMVEKYSDVLDLKIYWYILDKLC